MCRDYVVVLVHDVLDEVLVTDSKGVRESTKGWAGAGIIAGVGYRSHIRGGRGASRDNGWRQSSCRPPPLQGPPSKVPAPVPATKHLSVVLVWVLGSLWPSRMVPMAARRMGRLAFAAGWWKTLLDKMIEEHRGLEAVGFKEFPTERFILGEVCSLEFVFHVIPCSQCLEAFDKH